MCEGHELANPNLPLVHFLQYLEAISQHVEDNLVYFLCKISHHVYTYIHTRMGKKGGRKKRFTHGILYIGYGIHNFYTYICIIVYLLIYLDSESRFCRNVAFFVYSSV